MPPVPPGDDWTSWIIGTLMAMLATLVGTAVTLARMIDGKYVKQVSNLEDMLRVSQEEHKAELKELKIEIKECYDDRMRLTSRVAALESNTDAVQHNTDAVNRNTNRKHD